MDLGADLGFWEVQKGAAFSLQVLIKKSYDRSKRQRRRNWKLKELDRDREGTDTDDERFSICSPLTVTKLLQLQQPLKNLQLNGEKGENEREMSWE